MKRVTIILTFILTLCCWKGASQGLTSISIDKIVKTIDNDKGLKAVEVTDEKYLDEMVDFNGRIVGFFNRKELRKVAVYNKYKKISINIVIIYLMTSQFITRFMFQNMTGQTMKKLINQSFN